MKRLPKPIITPEDQAQVEILRDALTQTHGLPYADRWALTLELLSDDFLFYATLARKRKPEAMMGLFGPLALTAMDFLYGENVPSEEKPQIVSIAFYGLLVSFVVELERRHKAFTSSVVNVSDLFEYDMMNPVTLVPKEEGSEVPDLKALYTHYEEVAEAAQSSKAGSESKSAANGNGATA